MIKSALWVLGLLILISGLFVILLTALPRYSGAYQVKDTRGGIDLAILAAATFAGVMSNSLYDRVINKRPGSVLRRRDVILASVVAPIVMLPIYQTLQTGSDAVVLGLTAYQNGFFFSTWFGKLAEQR